MAGQQHDMRSSGSGSDHGQARPATQQGVDDVWRCLKASQTKNEHFERIWSGIKSDAGPRGVVKQPIISATVQGLGALYSKLKTDENDVKCAGKELYADAAADDSIDASALEQRLVAGDAAVRRSALKRIQSALSDAASSTSAAPATQPAATASFAPLLKPLLRRFDDAAEANREAAAACVGAIIEREPDAVLGAMPYIMPVLEERMARKPQGPVEPCEEVRLLLARLLARALSEAGLAARGYAAEAVAAIEAALADAYHEVNVAGCEAIVALTAALGERLQPAARRLAAAVLPLTTHARHRVRAAALRALKPLAHAGGHELILDMVGHRDPCLVPLSCFYGDSDVRANFAGRLAADANQQVRLEFVETVGDWMLRLRERRDHEGRLLPFVLAALADSSMPLAAAAAARVLGELGAQYEAERADELAELRAYYPEALAAAAGRPDDAEWGGFGAQLAAAAAAVSGSLQEDMEQQQQEQQPPATLQLGSRLLVQDNAGRLLPPLCGELGSWQDAPRAKCAALLRAVLALLGGAVERHLELLVPALLKAIARENDPATRADVEACCAVAGRAVPLAALLAVLLPRARAAAYDSSGSGSDDTSAVVGALLFAAHALRGAGSVAARRAEVGAECAQLLELLEHPRIGQSNDAHVRAAALELATQLVAACPRAALSAAAPRLIVAAALMMMLPGGGGGADAVAAAQEGSSSVPADELLEQLAVTLVDKGDGSLEKGDSSSSSSSSSSSPGRELVRRYVSEVKALLSDSCGGGVGAERSKRAAAAAAVEDLLSRLSIV